MAQELTAPLRATSSDGLTRIGVCSCRIATGADAAQAQQSRHASFTKDLPAHRDCDTTAATCTDTGESVSRCILLSDHDDEGIESGRWTRDTMKR